MWNFLNISFSPDYEKKSTYRIRLKTTRDNWQKYEMSFLINIRNLSETTHTSIWFEREGEYVNSLNYWKRNTFQVHNWDYSLKSENRWVANSESCFEISQLQKIMWNLSFYYYVSTEQNGDFLHFYIDDELQQSWSWISAWTKYSVENIPKWDHIYKWCYKKNETINSGSDSVYIDSIQLPKLSNDSEAPIISGSNFDSWALLPWGNHVIAIDFFDEDTWINHSSAQL